MAQRLKCLPATPSWVGKIPWRRKWQPTPVFLPGESHGWRSLVGYSPWSRKESDTTERLHFHFSTFLWLKNFSPLNPWGRVHLPACISHKRPILIIVLLSITLPLTEFLLHWDTMNLSFSKSRHQVSDFNEKIVGLSSKQVLFRFESLHMGSSSNLRWTISVWWRWRGGRQND